MGRSWLRLLAFLAFGLNIVMSQDADRVIIELETKTDGDAYNAGMGPGGHIRVAVHTPEVKNVLRLAHFHRMEAQS